MIKITIRNLGISLKPKTKKTNRKVACKMNQLSTVLSAFADNKIKKNNLHVIKWIDNRGFVNIAFQIVISRQLCDEQNPINDSSLVFAQNEMDEITMSIFQNTIDGLKSTHVNKVLGTYTYNELTEAFIFDKIKLLLNYKCDA